MKNGRRAYTLVTGAALVLSCLVVGAVAGAWFTTHYRIVRIAPGEALEAVSPPQLRLGTSQSPPDAVPSLAEAPESASLASRAAQATSYSGPFAFKFTPGEQLRYRLSADVKGRGFESTGPADVKLGISGEMNLKTERVDASGNGDLSLTYERMTTSGDFMGSPFSMDYSQGQTLIQNHGRTSVDTAHGIGSTKGIPQAQFFEDPVRMTIAPNGQVLHVSGGAGWADMIKEIPAFAPIEFPDSELRDGLQWDSYFALPVPGAGAPVKARMRNTVIGYQYLGNRYCAIIQQDIDSRGADGTLNMPKSSLGDEASFAMPFFELRGRNYVYFDVQRGQLVHSQSNLKLTMKIGQMLEKTAEAFQNFAQQLGEIFTGKKTNGGGSIFGDDGPDKQGLDLVLDINSTLSLDEAAQLPVAAAR